MKQKHSIKRALSLFLSILMLLSITAGMDFSAFAGEVITGKCGADLTYKIENRILTISGTGSMYSPDSYPYDRGPFYNDLRFWNLYVEEGVTGISLGAFTYCKNNLHEGLNYASFPDSLKSIGNRAFYGCGDLKNIDFGKGIEFVGSYAFSECNMSEVSLPNVKAIFEGAFLDCPSLKTVFIGNSVQEIDRWAFNECPKLSDIYYFGTEEEWNNIFISEGNGGLLNANIHYLYEGKCGDNAYYNFDEETGTLTISGTGATYDYGTDRVNRSPLPPWVYYYEDVKKIVVEDGITRLGDLTLGSLSNVTEFDIADSVTELGWVALGVHENLTTITLPKNLEVIGEQAIGFDYFLENVVLYNNVKRIERIAFYADKNLTDIYYIGSQEEWQAIDIDEDNQELFNATIHYNCCEANPIHGHEVELRDVVKASFDNDGYTGYSYCKYCNEFYGEGHEVYSVTPQLNRNIITTNGTVQRPLVYVYDSNGNQLEYKKDFKVDYSNWSSTDVGRYTVTVTMMGDYSGSKTYPYYINPRPTTFLTSAQGGFKSVKNGFKLTWNKQASQTTGYQIQYATKSDFSNAASYWVSNPNQTSATITGRAGGKRYYVRIRPYTKIGTGTFYGAWDNEKSYTKSVVTLK